MTTQQKLVKWWLVDWLPPGVVFSQHDLKSYFLFSLIFGVSNGSIEESTLLED